MDRTELNEALQGTVRVTFTKADGTERVMVCTQNPDLMNIAMAEYSDCLLYTSPSPRDRQKSRMPSSA